MVSMDSSIGEEVIPEEKIDFQYYGMIRYYDFEQKIL